MYVSGCGWREKIYKENSKESNEQCKKKLKIPLNANKQNHVWWMTQCRDQWRKYIKAMRNSDGFVRQRLLHIGEYCNQVG